MCFCLTEHEACGKDLGELKWHVMYRSRTEARLQSSLTNAQLLNSQLHEELERVKEHTLDIITVLFLSNLENKQTSDIVTVIF